MAGIGGYRTNDSGLTLMAEAAGSESSQHSLSVCSAAPNFFSFSGKWSVIKGVFIFSDKTQSKSLKILHVGTSDGIFRESLTLHRKDCSYLAQVELDNLCSLPQWLNLDGSHWTALEPMVKANPILTRYPLTLVATGTQVP